MKKREQRVKIIAVFLIINLISEICFPTVAYALTSGPELPEGKGFEPLGTNQMVDLYSGDFVKSFHVMTLPGPDGGYPFTLNYHSGITMDQEASWVGLGWDLSAGMIDRTIVGIPDDHSGDKVKSTAHRKPNNTIGLGVSKSIELLGKKLKGGALLSAVLGLNLSVYHNNYSGLGMNFSPTLGIHNVQHLTSYDKIAKGGKLNLSFDTQAGVGVSISGYFDEDKLFSAKRYTGGIGINSKRGLNLQTSIDSDNPLEGSKIHWGTSYNFNDNSYAPVLAASRMTLGVNLAFSPGGETVPFFGGMTFNGYYTRSWELSNGKERELDAYGYTYLQNRTKSKGFLLDFNREKDGLLRKESPNLASTKSTHDYYQVSGHGTGGGFRPYRSDFGHFTDATRFSSAFSPSFEAQVGVGPTGHSKVGAQYGLSFSFGFSGDWNNSVVSNYDFKGKTNSDWDYEPVYYKSKGEHTSFNLDELDAIGGEEAVKIAIDKDGAVNTTAGMIEALKQGLFAKARPKFINASDEIVKDDLSDHDTYRKNKERIGRLNNIQPLTNELIGNTPSQADEFDIRVYDDVNGIDETYKDQTPASIDRSIAEYPKHHVGGYTVLNPSGTRYVYGLPTYNDFEREYLMTKKSSDLCDQRVDLPESYVTGEKYKDKDYNNGENKNTEQLFRKTEKPRAAHGYRLTSVLGADYVDADDIPGPSEGDKGYYVKFNYVKTSDNYKWRAPFSGAMFSKGMDALTNDDKASFTYGEKDVWYLATAETKTHIAEFIISQRHDGYEAATEFNPLMNPGNGPNGSSNGLIGTQASYKLDKVKLYTKGEYAKQYPTPIQTVHFNYTYELCPNVPNNDWGVENSDWDGDGLVGNVNSNKGKLTLRSFYTTDGNNSRGALSPYVFNYSDHNPGYDYGKYHRWGGYKTNSQCGNVEFPYVDQFVPRADQATKEMFESDIHKDATAWHLSSINMPSGATINIEMESDDYSHVQHRKAMQMFEISSLNNGGWPGTISVYPTDWDVDQYKSTSLHYKKQNLQKLAVFFDLEKPVPVSSASGAAALRRQDLYRNYLSGLKRKNYEGKDIHQMYFKVKANLRADIFESISGYLEIEVQDAPLNNDPQNGDFYAYDLTNIETIDGVSMYTKGYVTLKLVESQRKKLVGGVENKIIPYHPMAVAIWQHLKIDNYNLMIQPDNFDMDEMESGDPDIDELLRQGMKIRTLAPEMFKAVKGYRKLCLKKRLGQKIKEGESWIRLDSPDGKKFGGGIRVKSISMTDNWNDVSSEANSTYGVVYDYTTTNEFGETVSSGVASNEPMIGADENALRYAKSYPDFIPFQTNANLYMEYPVNEQYYPGARVGYRKVTVKSLNTDNVLKEREKISPDPSTLAISTTGVTVNEFYTTKDFPTIVEETKMDKKHYDMFLPLKFLDYEGHNLTGSQGYAIKLNDMDGRPKAVTQYGQDKNAFVQWDRPLSNVHYHYKHKKRLYDNTQVNELVNEVDVLMSGDVIPGFSDTLSLDTNCLDLPTQKKVVGVEYEFFTDSRMSFDMSLGTSFSVDADVAWILPIPSAWPKFSFTHSRVRQMTTNKVIHKSGILEKVEASNGRSHVVTRSELYDPYTGEALLTSVDNNFNDKVYNYSTPARWNYESMGPAANNWGIEFLLIATDVSQIDEGILIGHSLNIKYQNPDGEYQLAVPSETKNLYQLLEEGDEFIVLAEDDQNNSYRAGTATLIHKQPDNKKVKFKCHGSLLLKAKQDEELKFFLSRSGYRNHLGTKSGSIASLSDPTKCWDKEENGTIVAPTKVTSDLADFFNTLILPDGKLKEGKYQFDNSNYYQPEHYPIYEELSKEFKQIWVLPEESGKYDLFYKRRDGTEGTITDFARTDQQGISHFSKIGSSILRVYYMNGTNESKTAPWNLHQYEDNYYFIKDVLSSSAAEFKDYWDHTGEYALYDWENHDDLYAEGKKGIWRAHRNFFYKDDRDKHTDLTTDLRNDGVYDGNSGDRKFYPYRWNREINTPLHPNWLTNQTITRYNDRGYETENRDVLGNYSCAQYGYGGDLNTAVAVNSLHDEVLFESYDDPDGLYYDHSNATSSTSAHSGIRLMTIAEGGDFLGNELHDLSTVNLKKGKKYVLSAWVKVPQAAGQTHTYDNGNRAIGIRYELSNSPQPITMHFDKIKPTGYIIEGWQKIEGTFTIPQNALNGVRIAAYSDLGDLQVDDLRVFPADGNMQSYVYDPEYLRLKAVLDHNNYATYYSYGERGEVYLIQKETERGVKTISENRGHIAE